LKPESLCLLFSSPFLVVESIDVLFSKLRSELLFDFFRDFCCWLIRLKASMSLFSKTETLIFFWMLVEDWMRISGGK